MYNFNERLCLLHINRLKGVPNMKLVYVVDSVSDIQSKVSMMQTRFGKDIYFVVKSPFQTLFSSFGYRINAIYTKNLAKVLHAMLLKCPVDDILLCYSSLNLNDQMLNNFLTKVGDGSRFVNLVPNYNFFEQIGNETYNIYVKSIFRNRDSMISPKLQYIPRQFVLELLSTHFANKLFEIDPKLVVNVHIEDKEINKSAKTKCKHNKFNLIPLIVALAITIALICTLAFTRPNYIFWLAMVFLYLLDGVMAIIFACKNRFDQRFLN